MIKTVVYLVTPLDRLAEEGLLPLVNRLHHWISIAYMMNYSINVDKNASIMSRNIADVYPERGGTREGLDQVEPHSREEHKGRFWSHKFLVNALSKTDRCNLSLLVRSDLELETG